MKHYRHDTTKHCRWDGKPYSAHKPHDRDGFCCPACKQAHYRAYKNYVTTKRLAAARAGGRPVTQKRPTRKKQQN